MFQVIYKAFKREYNEILANRKEKMDHRYNLGTIASEVRLTWLKS